MKKVVHASDESKEAKKSKVAASVGISLGKYDPYYRCATMSDISDFGADTSDYKKIGQGVISDDELEVCKDYELDPVGIVVAKDEYVDCLADNGLDILLACSDGGQVTLVQVIGGQEGSRMYNVDWDEIMQCVGGDADDEQDDEQDEW